AAPLSRVCLGQSKPVRSGQAPPGGVIPWHPIPLTPMADSTRPVRSVRWRMWPALLATAPGLSLFAQVPEASYPVDPVAAAGMTSGLPNTITSRQIEMMQVRTSAQSAQGEAAAASMARSADQSIEERNREAALE